MNDLLKQAIQITIDNDKVSTSLLQQKLIIGYNKANKLMDEMEKLGVVGPLQGTKPRELLIGNINDLKLL